MRLGRDDDVAATVDTDRRPSVLTPQSEIQLGELGEGLADGGMRVRGTALPSGTSLVWRSQ
jgi:hypothetical protein